MDEATESNLKGDWFDVGISQYNSRYCLTNHIFVLRTWQTKMYALNNQ
jgi:hypothetical protein